MQAHQAKGDATGTYGPACERWDLCLKLYHRRNVGINYFGRELEVKSPQTLACETPVDTRHIDRRDVVSRKA